MDCLLPNFLKFKQAKDLIRIGKNNDGGYLISEKDLKKSDFLLSLGICDDWSFESDFLEKNNVPLHAYDASLNLKFFIKNLIKISIIEIIKKIISYKKFFRGTNIHFQKFIGINNNKEGFYTLSSVLEDLNFQAIFLKIDIEGSEYRILDSIISNQQKISGLVIEFHDCDINLSKIECFIKNFNLKLVHIHANNHGLVDLDKKMPLVLELTFSKYCELDSQLNLPHSLDMRNGTNREEINLEFLD